MTALFGRTTRRLAEWWARSRVSQRQPAHPIDQLRSLLVKAADTRYGKEHGFYDISRSADCYERFAQQVPILDYEQWVNWLGEAGPLGPGGAHPLKDQAWPGTIDMFCLSSGTTTGRTRFVPYSQEMAAVNRQAALDFMANAIKTYPDLAPPHGRTLYMSGTTQIQRNEHGALCGDMSGLTKYLAPPMLDWVTLPPRHVSAMPHWENRLGALVELCLKRRDIVALSGIPIWQLTLLEKVAEKSGKPLPQVMPALRCLIHGGMSLQPYRQRLLDLMGPKALFLEVYAASETGIAAFQLPNQEGMAFQEDYGVFYEFQAPDGRILMGAELTPAVPYGLIVSSCSGLWRYRIGDVAVFKQTRPLILDYVTRDKTTSAFDEKITEKEVELAMESMSPSFSDFAMGPDTNARNHCWFLLGKDRPEASWLTQLDEHLRRNNEDYDDYRGDGRIKHPKMVLVPDRKVFLDFLGRLEGGQKKFPRLLSAAEVDRLLEVYPHQDQN